ncbi:hypothetical protein ALC62_07301 [Cyphomyrmex costatus]|uniref:Uncharacterized protein n=1 Tax=Cyphomyrmex costatus TaxID=456900 RepID=A0A195CNZ4_9HYME|nr:hypothetical protein ALC62_07301 [Cyphomyrmex costatus]
MIEGQRTRGAARAGRVARGRDEAKDILGGIWSTSASLSIHSPPFPRSSPQLASARCICIGKQTAAGSLWLARKMNKIMKKKGKFRVEMQKRAAERERKRERQRTAAQRTKEYKPSIPVSSRVTSIIRLECRRNKWSNHPPTLTIWRKQSSTAIHPYIVARTKSLATADLRYALYINQPPPIPIDFGLKFGEPSRAAAAASRVIDPLSVRSREFGALADRPTATPSYDHLPVHKSPKTRRAFRQLRAVPGAPDASSALSCITRLWNKTTRKEDPSNGCKHERVKGMTAAAMKMAGRPTLVEYKAAGGLGSESRGQSEPVGRARRQPQPQTERLRAASAPEHRPH